MDAIFGSIDFSAVATTVGAIGIAVVAIAVVYKAIDLAKRAVKKA